MLHGGTPCGHRGSFVRTHFHRTYSGKRTSSIFQFIFRTQCEVEGGEGFLRGIFRKLHSYSAYAQEAVFLTQP